MAAAERYPDFFIVGAQRGGTTSLYEHLRQHPQVFMSPQKETHFFARDRVQMDEDLYVNSEVDYLALFADASEGQLLGEACPSYLWHPEAAERIFAVQPKAKIIASLRNPIARAFSQYKMDLADGLEPIAFYDLILRDYKEEKRVYGTGHLYVELGMYALQLKRYMSRFGRENVLVLAFEDLCSKPREVLSCIAAFLEIDDDAFGEGDFSFAHNQNAIPASPLARKALSHRGIRQVYRTYVPLTWRQWVREQVFNSRVDVELDSKSVEYLREVYTPEVRELQELCEISFADFETMQGWDSE